MDAASGVIKFFLEAQNGKIGKVHNMTAYFITSTGTGIGKTHFVTRSIRASREKVEPISALKPIISGWQTDCLEENDTACILKALNLPFEEKWINQISPWRFMAPLSPDMAATQEGKEINFDDLISFCLAAIEKAAIVNQTLLIEGVGGAFVPLNQLYLVADWIRALQLPVILVTGNYLGTLSHTLSTVYALESRGVPVDQIILNENKLNQIDLEATHQSLSRSLAQPIQLCTYEATTEVVLPNFG
ncbi:MAG: dethiobiotin synthase [Gammaproteobacteria bacterium]